MKERLQVEMEWKELECLQKLNENKSKEQKSQHLIEQHGKKLEQNQKKNGKKKKQFVEKRKLKK